ncbi:MAG: DUF4013 domain-containing protein, partial [Candidatus Micrarchaeota archaeon]|nr:DUF4013 domain-containing protein [Candidatus Micrarchaeota archaeon]
MAIAGKANQFTLDGLKSLNQYFLYSFVAAVIGIAIIVLEIYSAGRLSSILFSTAGVMLGILVIIIVAAASILGLYGTLSLMLGLRDIRRSDLKSAPAYSSISRWLKYIIIAMVIALIILYAFIIMLFFSTFSLLSPAALSAPHAAPGTVTHQMAFAGASSTGYSGQFGQNATQLSSDPYIFTYSTDPGTQPEAVAIMVACGSYACGSSIYWPSDCNQVMLTPPGYDEALALALCNQTEGNTYAVTVPGTNYPKDQGVAVSDIKFADGVWGPASKSSSTVTAYSASICDTGPVLNSTASCSVATSSSPGAFCFAAAFGQLNKPSWPVKESAGGYWGTPSAMMGSAWPSGSTCSVTGEPNANMTAEKVTAPVLEAAGISVSPSGSTSGSNIQTTQYTTTAPFSTTSISGYATTSIYAQPTFQDFTCTAVSTQFSCSSTGISPVFSGQLGQSSNYGSSSGYDNPSAYEYVGSLPGTTMGTFISLWLYTNTTWTDANITFVPSGAKLNASGVPIVPFNSSDSVQAASIGEVNRIANIPVSSSLNASVDGTLWARYMVAGKAGWQYSELARITNQSPSYYTTTISYPTPTRASPKSSASLIIIVVAALLLL